VCTERETGKKSIYLWIEAIWLKHEEQNCTRKITCNSVEHVRYFKELKITYKILSGCLMVVGSRSIQVSHELRSLIQESVPYVKIYRYNTKHLCPKLNGYGDNGKRTGWTSWGCTHYICQLAVTYVRPCVGCHVTECAVSHVSQASHVQQRSAFQCHV